MSELSPLAEIVIPPTVWLDADAEPVKAANAAEALPEHEARQGVSFEISTETLASLADFSAAALLWVAFKRSHSARFRRPQELALNDAPAVVLGTDHKGGFLLWLTATEDEAMNDTTDSARFYRVHRPYGDADNWSPSLTARAAVEMFAADYGYDIAHNAFSAGIVVADDGNKKHRFVGSNYDDIAEQIADGEAYWIADAKLSQVFERTTGPERGPDPTPPTNDGERGPTLHDLIYGEATMVDDKPTFEIPVERLAPTPEAEQSSFVLIERSASGNQETGMTAHLYTDRDAATESARGFPMSQEDAARQGQTTWAEVHPVTAYFAENFETMQEAGRLDSMVALYSTAKEIDGHLAPAHPDEPGAITGQLRENDAAGDASPYGDEPKRPEHIRLVAAAEPAPDGTKSVRSTYLDPNDNPALRQANENARSAPVDDVDTWHAQRIEAEARTLDPMADRGANHYAVLQAITPEAGEQMADNLAAVAQSRDVDGGAPSLREIVTRQADESTARQGAELAEAQGITSADKPMTADERFAALMADAKAEVAAREERDEASMTHEATPGRTAGGPGMSMG